MPISRSMTGVIAVALFSVWQGAYAQTPLPQFSDSSFQACLADQAARNGWMFAEQVTSLSCPNRGIARIDGVQMLPNLAQFDVSGNQLLDVYPLSMLSKISALNLAGNQTLQGRDLIVALSRLPSLASLNLNGINIGSINNLNGLINPATRQPWPLVELNLGNTSLLDAQNGKSLDFLRSIPTLKKINVAGNGISNIDALGNMPQLEEMDLSNNRVQLVGMIRNANLTRLNLSGNSQVMVQEVAQLIRNNPGLTSLGLNGIAIGNSNNLGPLVDFRTGQPLALSELDLGNTGIKDASGNASLQFLMPFVNLRKLNLANLGINDIAPLAAMAQMTELDLSGNQVMTAGQLGQMRNLTRLNLSGNRSLRYEDIVPLLVNNPNLTSIGLNGIAIGPFNNVLGLLAGNPALAKNLLELDLGNTRIDGGNLNLLQSFPNLQRLNLAGNNLPAPTNLSALGMMRNLQDLDLSGNAIADVVGFMGVRTLTRLNLSNTAVRGSDIRPLLDQNPNLTSIGLNGVAIGDVSNLGTLRNGQTGQPYNLTELDLGNSGLPGRQGSPVFDFLKQFPNLQRLNLSGNGIVDVYQFQNMQDLSNLDLSNNNLFVMPPLWQVTALKRLNLSGNSRLRVSEVAALINQNPRLTSLGLNGIAIGSISNLGPLVDSRTNQPLGLTGLDLGNTGLLDQNGQKSVTFLAQFPNLQHLNLAGNGLNNIATVGSLNQLTDLDVSGNALVEVGSLRNLHNLRGVNLSGNTGLRFDDVFGNVLTGNPNLSRIGLNGIAIGQNSYQLGNFLNGPGQGNNLLELDLGNTQIDANILNQMSGLLNLQRLNLSGNHFLPMSNLYGLSNLHQLQELDLSGNAIQDLYGIMSLNTLKRLNLSNTLARVADVRGLLQQNQGLSSIGLNGIAINALNDLGTLHNWNGMPYNLTELDLGNTGVQRLMGGRGFDFLQQFTSLQKLNLAGNGATDVNELRNLPNLQELDLSNNLLQTLVLGNPGNLRRLNLSGNAALHVQEIAYLINQNPDLKSLGLNGIAIGQINNLGTLLDPRTGQPLGLIELDLGNTGLLDQNGQKSVSFLTPFPGLLRLNLAGNGLINLVGLNNAANLTEVDLSNNNLQDVSQLATARNLTRLNLSGNPALTVGQVRPLIDQAWNLTSLGLNGMALGDFSALGPMRNPQSGLPYNLQELDLGNTGLNGNGNSNLNWIAAFPNLLRVNLAGNGLINLNGFELLNKVTDLDLSGNQLADMYSISSLRSLTRLNLSGNSNLQVRFLAPLLTQNPGLTRLGLNGINLGTLNNVGSFNSNAGQPLNLVELDIGNTQLQDIDGLNFLGKFPGLASLNVAGNGLHSIYGVRTLPNLRNLDLSNNALVFAADLYGNRTLQTLNLQGNTTLQCADLDNLVISLPGVAVRRPATCVTQNQPPVANAGDNQIKLEGDTVSLLGNGIDPDGTISSYAWLQTGGPAVSLSAQNAAITSFIAPPVSGETMLSFQLTVLDDKGASATSTTNVTVKPKANQAPVADAGANQTVASGSAVTLAGSGTDSDGTISSYAWLQTAGPAVTLATPNSASASFTAPVVPVDTVLSFRLTVLDNKGGSASSTVNVTVKAKPNQPPLANAGSAQTVISGSTVALTGSGTDSDGTIASYVWLQLSGPSVSLAAPAAAGTNFTAPLVSVDSVLTFQLTVQDDKGATATSNVSITVKPKPNVPPVANAGGPQIVPSGSNVNLNGSGTDSDGTIASYGWTQTSGPAVTLVTPKAASSSFIAPLVSVDTVFNFTLTVLDDKGASGTSSVTVTVKPKPNQAPVVSAGSAQTVVEGASVTLAGTAQDADGSIASYAWVQTAGPAVTLTTPKAATTIFVAPQVSSDTVLSFKLTVTDNQGAVASATTSVTVKDAPDLKVSNIYVVASRTNPPRGSTIPVTVTTANSGNKATAAASSTALYLSTSSTSIDVGAAVLNTVSVPSGMAAGASLASSTSITIPSNMAPGVYYLWGVADYNGKVAEGNESNNRLLGPKITVY